MRVQRLLRAAGYSPGSEDGVCGEETVEAIKEFQKQFMADPDGLIPTEGLSWKKLAEAQQQVVGE